jgi:hypothetical protein
MEHPQKLVRDQYRSAQGGILKQPISSQVGTLKIVNTKKNGEVRIIRGQNLRNVKL